MWWFGLCSVFCGLCLWLCDLLVWWEYLFAVCYFVWFGLFVCLFILVLLLLIVLWYISSFIRYGDLCIVCWCRCLFGCFMVAFVLFEFGCLVLIEFSMWLIWLVVWCLLGLRGIWWFGDFGVVLFMRLLIV